MNLIKPNFEILDQGIGLEGVYKQIERVGRTCYKSEDKIAEGTSKPFVDRMIASKHLAMCEHGTIYLAIPRTTYAPDAVCTYIDNPYSKVNDCDEFVFTDKYGDKVTAWCVTTNLRVLVENDCLEDLEFLCDPTEYHAKRIAVKFTLDQGVMREFTRHRVFSFACESTRYCNYSKNKFSNEITFIRPCWDMDHIEESDFMDVLVTAENRYMKLIERGWTPQQARNVLPLATKCDLVMTGFVDDWNHFFDLRARGTTGAPHPQAKELAEPLLTEFIKRNIISL